MAIGRMRLSVKLLTGLAAVVLAAALLHAAVMAWWPLTPDEPAATVAGRHPFEGDTGRWAEPAEEATAVTPSPLTSPAALSRFRLHGVIPGPSEGHDVALIAVDGSDAVPMRVGEPVDGGFVLLGVSPGGAILGPPGGPPVLVLEVVAGPVASRARPRPGGGGASVVLEAVPLGPAAVAPIQRAARAAAGIEPADSVADDAPPLPEVDLVPDTLSTAQSPPSKPSPGRRQRLRPLSSVPNSGGTLGR